MDECEKLQTQVSQLSERVAENRGDLRGLLHRLEKLEEENKRLVDMLLSVQRQGDAIEGIRQRTNSLDQDLSSVSGRVSVIEK